MSTADILDTRDPRVVANPYDIYRELRANRDLVWSERLGLWLAPTHETANATLRTKSLGRIYEPQEPFDQWEIFNWLHSDSILDSETGPNEDTFYLFSTHKFPSRFVCMYLCMYVYIYILRCLRLCNDTRPVRVSVCI
jgi:hypothetical protein